MSRLSKTKRALFALALLALVLFALEAALRVAGFRYQRNVSYMQFNFPEPHTLHNIFKPDPELLWRMRPGYRMGEGFPPLNEQGFRGPEFVEKKSDNVFRVACLGDSVTFGGVEASFPALLERFLKKRLKETVEVMNFGVPGYSSFQGKKLAGRVLTKYDPDAVVILFGWNDHWLAQGFADHEQKMEEAPLAGVVETLRKARLYQLMARLAAAFAKPKDKPLVPRVPPGRYEKNLADMTKRAKENGAVVVLATSPSALPSGEMPSYLVENRFVKSGEKLKKLHENYNRIVKKLARQEGLRLADLDLIFRNRDVTSLFEEPENDIIHPNPQGYRLMAREIGKAVLKSRQEEKSE
ncbi:MAG: SGNH/GDSL hydrolase family protein [bacterium]